MTTSEVIDAVYTKYNIGDTIPCKDVRDFFTILFKRHRIKLGKNIDKNVIGVYFEIEETRINRNTTRAYKIKSKRL